MPEPDAITAHSEEKFALTTSRYFPDWLATCGVSIAFTTYQAGKLFLLGVKPDGAVSVFERSFPHCMGIAVSADARTLALATRFQIMRFDNVLPAGGATQQGYDALYAPHAAWTTGDLDTHDMGFDGALRPVFVSTLFGCIATVSDGHSLRPLWRPPFLSKLVAEDRCHLNGMAMVAGQPAYATAVSRSDVADGWRDRRRDGGVAIDVAADTVIAEGLSMPHSPRVHDGKLWLLNSGRGEFGHVDLATGRFEPVAFCPGYARGLTFVGNYAVVGLSMARENRTFAGLDLDDQLAARSAEPRCGLAVFDLSSGDMVHWVRIEGIIRELYDVAVLPGVRAPSAIGFMTDEVKHIISIDD